MKKYLNFRNVSRARYTYIDSDLLQFPGDQPDRNRPSFLSPHELWLDVCNILERLNRNAIKLCFKQVDLCGDEPDIE